MLNPNSVAANVRTLVFKLSIYAGGLILVWDLYRWLINPVDPAWKWDPVRLPVPDLPQVPLIKWPIETVLSWPAFIAVPVGGILAVLVLYIAWFNVLVPLFHLLLRLGSLALRKITRQRPSHLVICIDGTWNYPEQITDGVIAASNVYKFWDNLRGERNTLHEWSNGADRVKLFRFDGDGKRQVGLYYPGVGNKASYSMLGGMIGGAFGFGAKGIMRSAYRDIVRYYRSDADRITIVGFSRGAAIARWLASYIEQNGVPYFTLSDTVLGKPLVTALRRVRLWPAMREVKVNFLGVWDTVASFGVSKDILGIPFQQINLGKDFDVSSAVERAVHLLAVDERRDAFVPTLMDHPKPDASGHQALDVVEEVWFPGVHSNVGGGFPNDGLAKISLGFMCRRFVEAFADTELPVQVGATDFGDLEENVRGRLRPSESPMYQSITRRIPENATLHTSVIRKMAHPELEYCPEAVSDLLDRLEQKRTKSTHALERLEEHLEKSELERAKEKIAERCRINVVN